MAGRMDRSSNPFVGESFGGKRAAISQHSLVGVVMTPDVLASE